jgi:pimeloyl-ACP methyl ester carboxylesterase
MARAIIMRTPDPQIQFIRHEILVDGLETSFLEAGSGPPVVLLHGGEFGGEAEICWEATIPALARHFRVLAPDLLGFGRTAKVVDFVDGRMRRMRHLARFIELAGASSAPCIGNSMGGMLLLFDAASQSPLLSPRKIVTIAGGGALLDSEHTEALFAYDGSLEGMRKVVGALFHGEEWARDDAYVERRRAGSLAPGAWEAVAAARFRRPKHLQEARAPSEIDYSRIATKTLIIAGEQDKIKPQGWWNELTEQMDNAGVILIPDAGHCPQLEQPDMVNEALIAFLKSE